MMSENCKLTQVSLNSLQKAAVLYVLTVPSFQMSLYDLMLLLTTPDVPDCDPHKRDSSMSHSKQMPIMVYVFIQGTKPSSGCSNYDSCP